MIKNMNFNDREQMQMLTNQFAHELIIRTAIRLAAENLEQELEISAQEVIDVQPIRPAHPEFVNFIKGVKESVICNIKAGYERDLMIRNKVKKADSTNGD